MDEKEAIYKLKDGDKEAFEFLYRQYWAKVYNFTRLYITSALDTEDIVHEVFAKLWETRAFVNVNKNFNGFLFIVTRNIIFNQSRDSFNDTFYQLTAVEALEESYDIEEELITSDLRAHIDSLIALLPPRRQEVFRMSREEHLSYKEIATRLDLSEKTVERHIADAIKFLKKNLLLYSIFCQAIVISSSSPALQVPPLPVPLPPIIYRA